ncbi:DUF58 domain-containing protein [uncultured Paraglaciecola sp.]|uniref:DUF58 domain-containing protein n=1 Tax=uncultured Paraglaciecola sp. TaxID=1765024 RepID=UPI0025984B79|nr:DUF58 domain-containing protein [uncultured Paraglaciecola sp.]
MSIIQKQLNKWLDKRIPTANQYQLNHKSIFIFPSKFGALFIGLCGLLFLLGTNYQNNLMLLLCYFLVSIFLVSLLASYINFAKIHLQMGKTSEVFVGDNLHFPMWLNADQKTLQPNGLINFKFKSEKIKINIDKSLSSNGNQIDGNNFTNPVTLNLLCPKRGKVNLSRVSVECFYPLGLYRCWTHLSFPNNIIVFPKPIPCDITLAEKSLNESGESGKTCQQSLGQDDFSHLKSYQLGEPLNHVAWKQLAKGRGMVSKQFASEDSQIGWLSLKHTAASVGLSQAEMLESKLGKLCYQVTELSRKNQVFGLDLGKTKIAPSSGMEHRQSCLTALATYGDD